MKELEFPPVLIPRIFTHYPGKGIPGELSQGLNPGISFPWEFWVSTRGMELRNFILSREIPGMDPPWIWDLLGKDFKVFLG